MAGVTAATLSVAAAARAMNPVERINEKDMEQVRTEAISLGTYEKGGRQSLPSSAVDT